MRTDTSSFGTISLGIGCAYVLYRTSATLIRKYFIAKTTCLNEFHEIGIKSARKTEKLRGTAVICGGSIAGLLAAKACSDHFENVIIVESEEWVTTPDGYTGSHRKGLENKKRSHVAQYKGTHSFQPLLIETLIKWFPNMKEECEKLGGRLIPQMWPVFFSGVPFADTSIPRGNHPITIRMTRAGFETLLRRLVMNSCKNVRYLAGTATDCTGPSSAGLRWLRNLATKAGDEARIQKLDNLRSTYDPKQVYYTCEFDVPLELIPRLTAAGFPDWDSTGLTILVAPDAKLEHRFFSIMRKENNYLELLCGGWGMSGEISNIEDIRSFVSTLKLHRPPPPLIFGVLNLLEEHNVPFTVNFTRLGGAAYIPYNKYEYMPSNFIAMGDSVMKINPVKSLGCTKPCIEALLLNKLLNKCYRQKGTQADRLPADFSKKFHKMQASRIGSDWNASRGEDYNFPSTVPVKGDDPKTFGKFQNALVRLMIQMAMKDKDVATEFGYIRSGFAPPTDLFAPRILLKLLKFKLFDTSPLS